MLGAATGGRAVRRARPLQGHLQVPGGEPARLYHGDRPRRQAPCPPAERPTICRPGEEAPAETEKGCGEQAGRRRGIALLSRARHRNMLFITFLLKNLLRRKVRSALTLTGVALAVGTT